MPNLLNIGVSGLNAFQSALATVSHNISNATTEGYSRQRVELNSRVPVSAGNGFFGSGVEVSNVARFANEFITLQLQQAGAESARLSTFSELAGQIDNLLADDQGSITPTLQRFFSSIQDLSNDPSSSSAREVMLSEAQSLTGRFNFLDGQLQSQENDVNVRLRELTLEINSISDSIATLNEKIIASANSNNTNQPNDLLDQRDQLINELSKLVAVTTVKADNGALNVFIGNGQLIVFDGSTQALTTVQDQADFTQNNIAYVTSTGTLDISNQVAGGEIGGLLDFRNNILKPVRNELGLMAMVMADTFNTQHRQGMDLTSALGSDFFTVPAPTVTIHQNNTGTATVTPTITDYTALTASDYRLSFDGVNFTLTRLNDNTSVSGAGPLVMDGLNVAISAGAVAGDSFLVRPTHTGASNIDVAIQNTNEIAAANPIRVATQVSNVGDAEVSFNQILDITNADLLDTVEIVFNNPPTSFDILNITDATTIASGVAYTSGANIDVNGVRINISGNPEIGDTFSFEHNIAGFSDNRNALQLADLQVQKFVGGTASYQDAYAGTIGRVGTQTKQADIEGTAQSNLVTQIQAQRESLAGVNLDEEAANLIHFQQAYQAAAQTISVADTIFQSLINAFR